MLFRLSHRLLVLEGIPSQEVGIEVILLLYKCIRLIEFGMSTQEIGMEVILLSYNCKYFKFDGNQFQEEGIDLILFVYIYICVTESGIISDQLVISPDRLLLYIVK